MTEPAPPSRRRLSWKAILACALLGGVVLVLGRENLQVEATEDDIQRNILTAVKSTLTPAMFTDAFAADDVEGVGMLLEAADLAGVPVPQAIRDRFAHETSGWNWAWRKGKDCAEGAVTGMATSIAGVACSIAVDMTLIGDFRDGIPELGKLAQGEQPDMLILGLAGAGIALELAAPATGGTSLGAKAGTSVVKVSAKSGLASRRLLDEISAITSTSVNLAPLKALSAADLADTAKLRRVGAEAVDLRRLSPVADAADHLHQIAKRGSPSDALMVMKTAERLEDVTSANKLSKVFKDHTGAVLRALGRRALDLAKFTVKASIKAAWLLAGLLLWLASALLSVISFIGFMSRLWSRTRHRAVQA